MDYKETVFLPKTDFPMRGGLPSKEPEIIERWKNLDLYKKLRENRKNEEKFVLHDGPPYANGKLHIGHALNKILKDVINRSQSILGKNANYVPGWDCHGLPIEWQIEEKYRKEGKNKDEVPIDLFRKECRDFASYWLKIQSDEFQRLGVLGDWENPYSTMKFESEGIIASEICKFLMNGSLYRGSKPVMWSPVEKTALAEAEVEYSDHTSITIFAKFKVKSSPLEFLENTNLIIWTTTPWTIPGNRAMAYGSKINYTVYEIEEVLDKSLAIVGDKICFATLLKDNVFESSGIISAKEIVNFDGSEMAGTIAQHPLHGIGYDHDVPIFDANYVTTEQGTGFVHIAPGHGPEDYELAHLKHGVEVPDTVDEGGVLMEHLPLFAGLHVLRDNKKIANILAEKNGLIAIGKLTHSYPHSWRSHAPVIYRNASQWFVSMEKNELRNIALSELSKTQFYPPSGKKRLSSMIENRPDWCLSRQRAWGVPIPVFFNKKTGLPLKDENVNKRIIEAFAEKGCDIWFTSDPKIFLGDDYNADEYEKVFDIADVWFDSGSTHAFVLEDRNDLHTPADLYLEGSDQHRGWFHSSLLESCGTRGKAPYKGVLTHGFVLDEQGRKMSKSLGNVVTPQKIIQQNGADILRLWVVSSDYYDDLRIGPEIIKRQTDHYRRIRNTLRYLLGSIKDFSRKEMIVYEEMSELERWLLNRLFEIDKIIREKTINYDFHGIFTLLHDFCNNDLSAFYFDIRKDTLYCDSFMSIERMSCRVAMNFTFQCLVKWIAPILCFTAEEAWLSYNNDENDSVHFYTYFDIPKIWKNNQISSKWEKIRKFRSKVTASLEEARNQGVIGGSLSAEVNLEINKETAEFLVGVDLASLLITSKVEYEVKEISENKINILAASKEKCERCWKQILEINDTLCERCKNVIDENFSKK